MMIGDAMTPFDPVLLSMLKKWVLNSMLPFSMLTFFRYNLPLSHITFKFKGEKIIASKRSGMSLTSFVRTSSGLFQK